MAKTQPRGGQILDGSIKLDSPEQDVTGTLPATNGGTGLTTSGLDSTQVLKSDGAGGFVMGASNGTPEELAIAYAVAL